MVKGINRQVIVVRSPDPSLFEQAIFLLRPDAPESCNVTQDEASAPGAGGGKGLQHGAYPRGKTSKQAARAAFLGACRRRRGGACVACNELFLKKTRTGYFLSAFFCQRDSGALVFVHIVRAEDGCANPLLKGSCVAVLVVVGRLENLEVIPAARVVVGIAHGRPCRHSPSKHLCRACG